ncbi:Pimeloyl-ACP methyl ester carboxylesterase [Geodermatophilus amargosae]|uniref:Pimeloyl-ACP methyl ester carboxylesterase n=1 Tax=Geodermatophilus amargosae TaxID=1296565 RepID=A0A1I7BDR5_9ACTN|nr:alpha/beta hydrolase [Geodermatophilus amargosae]SFT85339.1 Pimeloyl-ACP methyl ester carboxylesterase [Geodermatophilus amargosae]
MTSVLEDGRRISWAEYGRASGVPLLFLHGTPGSRLQVRRMHGPAMAAGIRVVAPERPGYGASDPVPGGVTFTGYADDLRQLLDHLELPMVTLGGASGGGGFALATAILHPERVTRLVLISAAVPAPRSALRGMSPPLRVLLWLAAHTPGPTERLLAAQLSTDLASAASVRRRRRLPAADRRLFDDPTWRAHFADDFREAFRQGPRATVHDLRPWREPLGVNLVNLTVETVLLHGSDDVNVPIGIARWFAAQVPSSRLIETPGAAHLFTLEHPEVILEWVAPR